MTLPILPRLLLAALLSLAALAARAEVAIQEVTSPGGIRAWLVEEPSIPFTALEIEVRGGANLDREGKRGATNLMMALIEEGAGDLDAQAFQEAREGLAARFGFEAFDDSVSVSATMLTERRDEAVALLRDAILRPRFDADAVERVRGQVLAGIARDAQDPGEIAWRALAAAAYPGHPYGTSLDGTAESVAALTRDDLVAAHRDAFVRSRVFVGAVGDITPEELGLLLDELLGGLPEDGPPLPPRVEPAEGGGVTVIPYPTPQAVVAFGQRGIARDHPDYFAAFVLDHVLGGGGFESRLMAEVREERGLTYGIGTALLSRDLSDAWVGSTSSANATVAQAVEVIREEWARVAAEGITAEELRAAKTFLTGEYPLRFDGNAEIAGILVGMQMIGLPPDYVVNRNGFVEAVTLEDVARVAADLLDPGALRFVVVGEPVGLGDDADAPADAAPWPEPDPAAARPAADAPGEPAPAVAVPEGEAPGTAPGTSPATAPEPEPAGAP